MLILILLLHSFKRILENRYVVCVKNGIGHKMYWQKNLALQKLI